MIDKVRALRIRLHWEPRDLWVGLTWDHQLRGGELVKTVRAGVIPGLTCVLQLHLPVDHEREWSSYDELVDHAVREGLLERRGEDRRREPGGMAAVDGLNRRTEARRAVDRMQATADEVHRIAGGVRGAISESDYRRIYEEEFR